MLARINHICLSWAREIQSILNKIYLRSISILSSNLRLSLRSGVHPGFPNKTLYAFLSALIHATSSVHLIFISFVILIIILWRVQDMKFPWNITQKCEIIVA
jgi:hypothetical protein